MKYCTNCGAEYQDTVAHCSDCDFSELVSEQEMRKRGLPISGEVDTRRFARAGTVDDPLFAEQVANALRSENISVFARQRMGGTVDRLTDGVTPYWEILVAEADVPRAVELIEQIRENFRATEEEAVRAAEEEEAETELPAAQMEAKPV